MFLMFKSAWKYRSFILHSIKSEITGRYARSKFGSIWLFLQPLAQAVILAVVLSQLVGTRLSGIDSDYAYAVYLLAGILGWNLFSETTSNLIAMFKDRSNLVTKVNFPKICIPLIVIGSALVNHFIMAVIVVTLIFFLGVAPSSYLLLLPLLIAVNLGLSLGIGLILSIFEVFSRDVGQVWQIVVQFLFWLTPIVYTKDVLPDSVTGALKYNPLYWIVDGYHHAICYGVLPEYKPLLIILCTSLILLVVGFFLFIRASTDMVDAL